jgi:hypothetical protein
LNSRVVPNPSRLSCTQVRRIRKNGRAPTRLRSAYSVIAPRSYTA